MGISQAALDEEDDGLCATYAVRVCIVKECDGVIASYRARRLLRCVRRAA